jgi:hypothetical protein
VFNCDAARQDEWLEHLTTLNQVQRGLPGLISAPLHRGANGRTVANYVVRAAAEGWKAVTRHPDVVEDMRPIMAFATFEPHLQEPGEVIS